MAATSHVSNESGRGSCGLVVGMAIISRCVGGQSCHNTQNGMRQTCCGYTQRLVATEVQDLDDMVE